MTLDINDSAYVYTYTLYMMWTNCDTVVSFKNFRKFSIIRQNILNQCSVAYEDFENNIDT